MSCDMPREAEALLSAYGECVRIPPLASLPAPVCAHPDMQMALLGGKMIIHSENTALSEILRKRHIPYIAEPRAAGDANPHDVRRNCFALAAFSSAVNIPRRRRLPQRCPQGLPLW